MPENLSHCTIFLTGIFINHHLFTCAILNNILVTFLKHFLPLTSSLEYWLLWSTWISGTDLKLTHQTKLLCKWQKWHILVRKGYLGYFWIYFTFTTKTLSLDYSHFESMTIELSWAHEKELVFQQSVKKSAFKQYHQLRDFLGFYQLYLVKVDFTLWDNYVLKIP